MKTDERIYVAGHSGMVGSAIVRKLIECGYTNLVTRASKELDLRRQDQVEKFFLTEKPKHVVVAAAKVGGVLANMSAPAEFIYDNLLIETNVIRSAWQNGCKNLLLLGSACVYPFGAQQPFTESSILTSSLHQSHEAYALAKIAGIKYCTYLNRQYGTYYRSIIPTNLYGPNDNYHLQHSHVVPALIRRFHEAKKNNCQQVVCWGDGSPLRSFLYVNDLAELCILLMNSETHEEIINAGTGIETSIKNLSETIASIVGYKGRMIWDTLKPNGTMRMTLDVSKARALGWRHQTKLEDGLQKTYEDYLYADTLAER